MEQTQAWEALVIAVGCGPQGTGSVFHLTYGSKHSGSLRRVPFAWPGLGDVGASTCLC